MCDQATLTLSSSKGFSVLRLVTEYEFALHIAPCFVSATERYHVLSGRQMDRQSLYYSKSLPHCSIQFFVLKENEKAGNSMIWTFRVLKNAIPGGTAPKRSGNSRSCYGKKSEARVDWYDSFCVGRNFGCCSMEVSGCRRQLI